MSTSTGRPRARSAFQETVQAFKEITFEQRKTSWVTDQRYGSTQAPVLSGRHQPYATILRFGTIADTGKQEVQTLTERHPDCITTILEVDDYPHSRPATCKPVHKALGPYRGFKKLFGERMHARQYPAINSGVEFMKLPGEIRNRIYRYLLVMKPAIEFAPKTPTTTWKAPPKIERNPVMRCKKLNPVLRLLRLNKQINKEASEIYYGENEFRFTRLDGWFLFHGFLKTIGMANVCRLSNVTIHAPWYGRHSAEGDHWCSRLGYTLYARGLQSTKAPCDESPFSQSINILTMVGASPRITLALPFDFHFFAVTPAVANQLSAFSVRIIHLSGFYDQEPHETQQPLVVRASLDWDNYEVIEEHETVEAYAMAQGWTYVKAFLDYKGRYDFSMLPILPRDDDE